MTDHARTPEDVDLLLEDAVVLGEPAGFQSLFDEDALLVDARGREARGHEAIARLLGELRGRERAYVAGPARGLRNRDLALGVADGGTHVLRRSPGPIWRVTISLLEPPDRTEDP